VTRVNVASITTGRYPGGHGLAGNSFVNRGFDPGRVLEALRPDLSAIRESMGQLLLAPNLAEVLGSHGKEYVAIGTGSNGNAYLQNPYADTVGGATIHPTFCEPSDLHEDLVARYGSWPALAYPAEERLERAVTILTEYVLAEREPAVALFWSSEPDSSQHQAGVGSSLVTHALAVADRQFGRLLDWLDNSGRAGDTDVIVGADHGHSTAMEDIDIERLVLDAGFPSGAGSGCVLVAENGGSALFYVGERDRATADRLAAWLMEQPWCGALVASNAVGDLEGTLPASLVGIEGPLAPDIAMSFVWDSKPNQAGYPGHLYNTGNAPGLGNHGSMSRQEQRCALIARGPSFRKDVVVDAPSGNVDLAPTILALLGIDIPGKMDGRVLSEALAHGQDPNPVEWSTEAHTAKRTVAGGVYTQGITVSRVGSTTYVDEGNATLDR